MEATEFIIINDWKEEVTVFITLDVSESYVAEVSQIPFVKKRINMYQGSFQIAPQKFVIYKSPSEMIFGGKISFNSLPLNRPIPSFPTGINVAGFTINNHRDLPKTYESISINNSCGANAKIKWTANGGGNWTTKRVHASGNNLEKNTQINRADHFSSFSMAYENNEMDSFAAISASTNDGLNNTMAFTAKRPANSAGGIVALTYLGPTNSNANLN